MTRPKKKKPEKYHADNGGGDSRNVSFDPENGDVGGFSASGEPYYLTAPIFSDATHSGLNRLPASYSSLTSSGRMDPFESFAATRTPLERSLMDHCKSFPTLIPFARSCRTKTII